jgi:nucleoside-diphosphate-sugar epimerase
MNLLINGSATPIGRVLVAQLSDSDHELRLTSTSAYEPQGVIVCELGHDEATDAIVSGIDAIINVGYQSEVEMPVDLRLDYSTRRTYNLLWAAADAGVKRVVNLSTLRLMAEYEENLVVTENWRSRPLASDIDLLCAHLVEIICKEFARDRKFEVVNLRLGWPLVEGGPDRVGDSGSAALCSEDLGRAVLAALTTDIEPWQDIHIQSPVPDQRYTTAKASDRLGF